MLYSTSPLPSLLLSFPSFSLLFPSIHMNKRIRDKEEERIRDKRITGRIREQNKRENKGILSYSLIFSYSITVGPWNTSLFGSQLCSYFKTFALQGTKIYVSLWEKSLIGVRPPPKATNVFFFINFCTFYCISGGCSNSWVSAWVIEWGSGGEGEWEWEGRGNVALSIFLPQLITLLFPI